MPVGLTEARKSPLFPFVPATEPDVTQVFALLDEVDSWLESVLLNAIRWINSGLHVALTRTSVMRWRAQKTDDFDQFLRYAEHRQDIMDNMDY